MITCLIGHRGVGKTELSHRLQRLEGFREILMKDLDEEIEKKVGRPIFDIILSDGEAYFREVEKQVFTELMQIQAQDLWIVLGAGFPVATLPEEVRVVWVRRSTDIDGRIFLDRPRLNADISPLAEFQHRARSREIHYAARADWVYWMPEGNFNRSQQARRIEEEIFGVAKQRTTATVTANRSWFQTTQSLEMWSQHLAGRYRYIELRDDLLSEEQMQSIVKALPFESFLYSYRLKPERMNKESSIKALDWALEVGEPSADFLATDWTKRYLSWHGDLEEGIEKFTKYQTQKFNFKLASPITSWKELWMGWQWQQRDPSRRSFLPMSMDQRWTWVRQLLKEKQDLNFVKEGDGSAGDQPTLSQFLQIPDPGDKMHFAAVLGDPVYHSWSPVEHLDYFSAQGIPFVAIKVTEKEWDEAITVLEKMGLQFAAVTSPLKEKAQQLISAARPVNTLYFDGKAWRGTSTDAQGFAAQMEGVYALVQLQSQMAIWGGGGVLPSLEEVLPHAHYFSARNKTERKTGQAAVEFQPELVVWSAPRGSENSFPPEEWKPKVVVDLNYKEDSLGREYAQRLSCLYISGEEMFRVQAQAQRLYWQKLQGEN